MNHSKQKMGTAPHIDSRLREQGLPSVLVLKNGLQGNSASNPEVYLRELLNHSIYFMNKSHGEEYKTPNSESHGENDAITNAYEIDFKTMISTSMARGIRETSLQKVELIPGVVATTSAKSKDKFDVTYLTRILRRKTFDYFKNEEYKADDLQIASDIKYFLNVLKKDKNILLFMPSKFFMEGLKEDEDPFGILTDALSYDMKGVLQYRLNCVPNKETYFSTIYGAGDQFCIWRYEDGQLHFIDKVPLKCSNTFMYLAQFA